MQVLVFGDSHTAALRRGQSSIDIDGQWPKTIELTVRPLGGGHLSTLPFFVDRGDHAEVTLPEYRREFSRIPLEGDAEEVVYGVSAPLHPVRVWRSPAWQEFAPVDAYVLVNSVAPVSSGMIRRLALADQRFMLDLLALLRRLGRRVFVIEAPRPFRHHPALRKTRADVVMRVDTLYRETIRAELDRLGVDVIEIPACCIDSEGFTLERFGHANDPHHGNESYGAMVMGEVLAYLGRSVAQTASMPHRGAVIA